MATDSLDRWIRNKGTKAIVRSRQRSTTGSWSRARLLYALGALLSGRRAP